MKKDETLLWVKDHAKAKKSKSYILVAGNAVFSVCSVIFALLCRGAVDHAVSGEPEITLGSAAGLAIIVLLQLFLRLLCNSIEESEKARIETELRREALEKLMKKDYSSVAGFRGGELLIRMFTDISVIADGVTRNFPVFVNMVTRLVCAASVMLLLDTEFAALFIAAGVVYYILSRVIVGRTKALRRNVREKEEDARQLMRETLDGLLSIRTFGAERKVLRTNNEKQEMYYNARMKRRAASIAAGAGFSFAFQAGYLYAVIWGAFSILNGTMTFGTLVAVLQLVNMIQTPYTGLSALTSSYYGMLGSAERLMELEQLPDERPASKTLAADDFESLIAQDVCFSHGENRIIKNASFEIKRGDIVSIEGVSGGGKTTLIMLLLGIYKPETGAVRFLSHNEEYAPGAGTRGLFAYVPHESGIFSGTVEENIAFLNDNARTDEIRSAAKTACALELIEALPDGFETRIGDGGLDVSKGMAQRLAVARAVLSGAPFIILDGATNALDEESEAKLIGNIMALKNRTLIAAVDRSSAVKICERHLRLHDGTVNEEIRV